MSLHMDTMRRSQLASDQPQEESVRGRLALAATQRSSPALLSGSWDRPGREPQLKEATGPSSLSSQLQARRKGVGRKAMMCCRACQMVALERGWSLIGFSACL